MTESKIGQRMSAWCSNCRGTRNCEIHGHHTERGDDGQIQWFRDWYLLTCCGCDHVFAQSVSTDSESYSPYYELNGEVGYEYHETIVMWPAKAKRERPGWYDGGTVESEHATVRLDASLRELYGALDADLNVLASIGMRTTFDIAAENLGVDQELRFEQKIDDLVAKGAIKASERDHIFMLVDAGSASAHRGWEPKISELHTLMDILEEFVFNSFVLPARVKAKAEEVAKLKLKVPPKSPRQKKQKRPSSSVDDAP